ncbi:MAG: outer membrane beta-barrel family protein, partial [Bacteroidota bacterium]
PSAHTTWHLKEFHDLQLSYSRRVRRPSYFELSPFVTLANGRNFFSGNPDLNPEFTHSLELSFLRQFEKGSFSSSVYYRSSDSTINSIRAVDDEGFSTRLPENLIGQEVYGLEMIYSYVLSPWWKLDVSLNGYRAITDGTNIDPTFESEAYSWVARQTSRFTLKGNWVIQLRGNYQAPEITPQGKSKSVAFMDLSVKKDIWNRRGSLTLNAVDVFNTRIYRSEFRTDTFFTDSESQYRRRQINLTLSYRLKN